MSSSSGQLTFSLIIIIIIITIVHSSLISIFRLSAKMVNSKTVISALALSALAAAAPAPVPVPGKTTSFSINQVAVKKPVAHPAAKYAKALAKFGAQVPANVASAAASGQSGSATNNPTSNDEEYVTPITAGKSTLNLDFDTGSSDLYVLFLRQSSRLKYVS